MTQRIVQHKVFLQYPKEGEQGIWDRPQDEEGAEKFVDIDRHSGGYPYGTSIDNAHDFKTVEEAIKYRGHFKQLQVRKVTITYDVEDAEPASNCILCDQNIDHGNCASS